MEKIKLSEDVKASAKLLVENFGDDVGEAVNYMLALEFKFPEKPRKPSLNRNHNAAEARDYVKALEVYEASLAPYKTAKEEYSKGAFHFRAILEEYIKIISGVNDIPEQYRDKVYKYAYERGHSGGFREVYDILNELVEIFQ